MGSSFAEMAFFRSPTALSMSAISFTVCKGRKKSLFWIEVSSIKDNYTKKTGTTEKVNSKLQLYDKVWIYGNVVLFYHMYLK